MSAPAFPTDLTKPLPKPMKEQAAESPLEVLDGMMQALASLKLTVVLFALGIFVVFVGTLAQTQADIWQVVRDYFHAWVMWIDINLFFPKSFFPNYKPIEFPRIPFPGGYTIGALMAVNLIAAHGWRFKIQASGVRLIAGLATIALGVLITAVVVMAGHNDEGFQAKPPFSWDVFWQAFLGVSALTWVGGCLLFGVLAVKPLVADRSGPIPPVRLIVAGLAGLVLVSLAALLAWGFLAPVRPGDEAVRIVWQLMQGGFGGLVMLAGCILVFRKRGGMVLLHAGIGLLMVNELFVARQAAEWQIFLQEGQTTDHMRDIRAVELAVIDRSAEKTDTHTVIPQQMLRDNFASNIEAAKADKPAQSIKSSELPFQVAVLDYYANADVRTRKPGEETPATKGRGLTEAIVPLSAAKGTDTGGSVDMAAAYVRLTGKDGQDLGTYLLSQLASEQLNPEKFAERVTVDGKEYQLLEGRLRRVEYAPQLLVGCADRRSGGGGRPAGPHQDERSAAVSGAHVLSKWLQRHAAGGSHDAASSAEPGLDDSLRGLRRGSDRHAGPLPDHGHAVRHPPRRGRVGLGRSRPSGFGGWF